MRMMVTLGLLLMTQGFAVADFISLTKANGDFLAGTGIPNLNFTVNSGVGGSETGVQIGSRDSRALLGQVGNTYYVQTGLASNNISPWWQFDYQFSPGISGLPPQDVIVALRVDFDPTAAVSYTTIILPANLWGGDFLINPANGNWSDNTTPYAVSGSLNMGFNFWQGLGAPAFNPNAPGQYDILFGAYHPNEGGTIAETHVVAMVVAVPVPPGMVQAGIGMSLVGAIWLAQYRKRRQQRSSVIAA